MGAISFSTREILLKVVYYGPGFSGKTTSLAAIHRSIPMPRRSRMVSIATETERTLHFDFLPMTLAKLRDFDVRLQLYTVPGQVFYGSTREMVLRGADGVVFVADSQPEMLESNLVSMDDLAENLIRQRLSITRMPLVIQYNKRDLPAVLPIKEMQEHINYLDRPYFPTTATTAKGVLDALKKISTLAMKDYVRKHRIQ